MYVEPPAPPHAGRGERTVTQTFTLLQMAAHLRAVQRDMEMATQAMLAEIAILIRDRAKDMLGHNNPGWAPLAASTLARKAYPTPLLETAALRNSIGVTLGHHEAWIGSNLDRAVFNELGTSRIPPRPFLVPAAMSAEREIRKIALKHLRIVWSGKGMFSHEWRELLHAARELYHMGKELAETMTEDTSEKRR